MKILPSHPIRQRQEDGSIVVVFIILLSIMVILTAANSKSLIILHRQIKLLDQQQIKRLIDSQTNTLTVAVSTAELQFK